MAIGSSVPVVPPGLEPALAHFLRRLAEESRRMAEVAVAVAAADSAGDGLTASQVRTLINRSPSPSWALKGNPDIVPAVKRDGVAVVFARHDRRAGGSRRARSKPAPSRDVPTGVNWFTTVTNSDGSHDTSSALYLCFGVTRPSDGFYVWGEPIFTGLGYVGR